MKENSPEWLCREVLEKARDAIIVADQDGLVRFWNAGAERIFGYRRDEAIGRSLDLIIPERLQERHWEGYRKVMATGATRYGDDVLAVPALRRDGGRISIEFTILLLRNDGGALRHSPEGERSRIESPEDTTGAASGKPGGRSSPGPGSRLLGISPDVVLRGDRVVLPEPPP